MEAPTDSGNQVTKVIHSKRREIPEMGIKIPFYFLESDSFHNDDTYDALNEPKHENVTDATLLLLTGN